MKRLVIGLSTLTRTRPVVVLVAVLVLTAVFGVLNGRIETASGNEGFAPDNPELVASERIGEEFGSAGDTVMQVVLEGGDGGDVISADGLAAALAIQQAVLSSEYAEYLVMRDDQPPLLTHMVGVAQAVEMQGIDPTTLDDAAVDELFTTTLAQVPDDQRAFITGLLPGDADPESAAAERALALVFLDSTRFGEDFELLTEVQTGIADAIAEAPLPATIEARPFGFGLLFGDEGFLGEVGRLFALAFGIIVLILASVYFFRPKGRTLVGVRRTFADVGLTMLVIVVAIVWMNGIQGLLGPGVLGWIGPQAETGQILPVLLIGLGVDYAIHLTTRYREELGDGHAASEAIGIAIRTVGIALVLATVTTAVGFLTNLTTPMPALRDFGVIAAAGIISAFLLMLTLFPAVRLLLDRRGEARGTLPVDAFGKNGSRLLPLIMSKVAVTAKRVPVLTLILTLGVGGALGTIGMLNLEAEFSFTDFLPEDSPLVETLDTIAEDFGGGFGETTNILVTGDVATPATHNALVAAQTGLAQLDDVVLFGEQAAANSPVSVLATLLGAGAQAAEAGAAGSGAEGAPPAGGAPDAAAEGGQVPAAPVDPAVLQQLAGMVNPDLTVPDDTDVAELYTILLEAAPEQAGQVIGEDLDVVRVAVQTTAGEAGAGPLAEALDQLFAPVEDAAGDVVATSDNIISDKIVTSLQSSQLQSLFVAVLAAMLLLVVNFWFEARRPLLGVITIAPVGLIVLWTFGMMAATGIPIGPVTATIAALAVGIGVPYTIHVTHRFMEDRGRFATTEEAIASTVTHTGGALLGSAFTTMAGFGVLITSSLKPFQQFGLVTVYSLSFALVAAAVVLPSLLVLWDRYRRRKGDTGGVDLLADEAPAEVGA